MQDKGKSGITEVYIVFKITMEIKEYTCDSVVQYDVAQMGERRLLIQVVHVLTTGESWTGAIRLSTQAPPTQCCVRRWERSLEADRILCSESRSLIH